MYGFCLAIGMGYGFKFPAFQLGGSKDLWVIGKYGLSGLWVMRESTVFLPIQFWLKVQTRQEGLKLLRVYF